MILEELMVPKRLRDLLAFTSSGEKCAKSGKVALLAMCENDHRNAIVESEKNVSRSHASSVSERLLHPGHVRCAGNWMVPSMSQDPMDQLAAGGSK